MSELEKLVEQDIKAWFYKKYGVEPSYPLTRSTINQYWKEKLN